MTATGRKPSQLVSEKCLKNSCFHNNIARTIIKKYNRAIANELESRDYFEDLSAVPTVGEIEKWDAEISEAEKKCTSQPEAMDVMAPRIPKGQELILLTNFMAQNLRALAPTLADKRLELMKEPERGVAGETAWMIAGFKLEEQQWVLVIYFIPPA